MTLNLDYTQRLNLVAILDMMEVQGRREVHAICNLQNFIDLSDDEKKEINYTKQKATDGREYAMWAANGSADHVKKFEFSEADKDRITKAIDGYRVILARDKSWWMPLIAQIPIVEEK